MLFFALTFSFLSFCNAITLSCIYGLYLDITYYCIATVVDDKINQGVTKITGIHLSGKTNDDVQAIIFRDQNLDYVPKNITKFFKNNINFQIIGTSLKEISKFDLQQFPDLTYCGIRYNYLETIDGDLFSFTPKLVFIRIEGNRITNVGPNFLINLKYLQSIDFSRNQCLNYDSVNDTPDKIANLIRSLHHMCPPTADMVEKIVVSGPKLEAKILEKIFKKVWPEIGKLNSKVKIDRAKIKGLAYQVLKMKPEINELTSNVDKNQKNIEELINRVVELEKNIPDTNSTTWGPDETTNIPKI
jgi:hypothetical protein